MRRCGLLALSLVPFWVEAQSVATADRVYQLLDQVFAWQMAHLSDDEEQLGWKHGAYYSGVSALWQATGESRYRDAILASGNIADWVLRLRTWGKGLYHADDHCIGQSWLELHLTMEDPDPNWYANTKKRIDTIMRRPKPGREDMDWVDALFMSPPVYARLYAITGDESYLSFIDGQVADVVDYLFNEDWNLFYRDASYFDDVEPNGAPVFWSRGNGWAMGGIVRMLQYLPMDWEGRQNYLDLLERMAQALRGLQNSDDGMWRTSLAYPARFDGGPEGSGTAFFTYAMAWAVNEGLLEAEIYGPVIEAAWSGLASLVNEDGSLNRFQQVGAAPAQWDGGFTNREYGYGAFMLAGTEMARYFRRDWGTWPVDAYGNANTGAFLGWLNVAHRPWVWSYVVQQYLYVPPPAPSASGDWVYIPR